MQEQPKLRLWQMSAWRTAPWTPPPSDRDGYLSIVDGQRFAPSEVEGLFEWSGYWIVLGLVQEGSQVEISYLEVQRIKRSARGKLPPPITKPGVLKRLPLSDMVSRLEKAYWGDFFRWLEKPTSRANDPDMEKLYTKLVRAVPRRATEALKTPARTGRGRPSKPLTELQEVARLYLEGGRARVLEQFPNYGNSTVDHWIRKCRDEGMIPESPIQKERTKR